MNVFGKKLINGVRTLDYCYGLVLDADIVCNSICLPNEDLWHQRWDMLATNISKFYLSMS